MQKDNNNLTFETGGAIEMLTARFNQITAAKTHFFVLRGDYPQIDAKLKLFRQTDKSEKTARAELLATIAERVENWLTNFSLLLDTDQKILATKNEQIAKIAAQMKITVAKKVQTLPDEWKVAKERFVAAFNALPMRDILSLNETGKNAVETLMAEINPKNQGIVEVYYRLIGDAKKAKDNDLQKEIQDDYTNNIKPLFAKLKQYNQLINNSPVSKLPANSGTRASYTKLAEQTSDALPKLNADLQGLQAELKKLQNSANPDWAKSKIADTELKIADTKAKIKLLADYQQNLAEFAATEKFKVSEKEYASDGVAFIGLTQENGEEFLELTLNSTYIDGLAPALQEPMRQRTIAHEMQHALQWKAGKLAYIKGTKDVSYLFYDINDEVEAFKAEYLICGRDPVKKAQGVMEVDDNVDMITAEYLKKRTTYADLPNANLSIDSTLAGIAKAGGLAQEALKFLLKEIKDAGVTIQYDNSTISKIQIIVPLDPDDKPEASRKGFTCDDLAFKDFLKELKKYYPESLEKLSLYLNFKP